jgi:aminopeptidase N
VKQIIYNTILLIIFPAILLAQEKEPFFTDKIAEQESKYYELKSGFVESASYSEYDLVYQKMEWEVNPEIYYIKGAVTSHFVSKSDSLSDIDFDLHAQLIVDSIIQNGKQLVYLREGNKISIGLDRKLNKDKKDSLTIYYQGEPGDSGFGSFERRSHNGVPIIWTLSEPYGALDWWPCKQSLSDKIDSIDIIVTTPEEYRTASNGVLVSEIVNDNLRKMHWKHRHPIATYLVAIAVTNYINYSDFVDLGDGRKIEIQNFVYPEDESDARENTPITIEIMELFNNLIGEYPFADEKYGHAQFGWGGGMEHQTISFMYNFGFELVAHELAHQWFGDYITLATWQDIWLNEGFATYLSGLAYENLLEEYWWQRWKRLNMERITSNPGGSVFVEDTTNIGQLFSSRLSYSKGGYLLHMLRWVLGDEVFFQALRNYFEDPEIANGFSTTNQFVHHLESVADTSLTEFFDDWFYGEGFPIYSVQFKNTQTQQLEITLSQITSHESVDFFEMPVPVRVYNRSKTDSANFRLNHTQNNQVFTVDPGFEVTELKIDPESWLISKTEEVVKVPIIEEEPEFSVFPNPFTEDISISISNFKKPVQLGLFDVNGKLIKQLEIISKTINLSNLSTGVYVLQLKTADKIIERKIIKQ